MFPPNHSLAYPGKTFGYATVREPSLLSYISKMFIQTHQIVTLIHLFIILYAKVFVLSYYRTTLLSHTSMRKIQTSGWLNSTLGEKTFFVLITVYRHINDTLIS